MELDCRRCGACCVNLPANAAEGFVSWVEVEPGARLLGRADRVHKLVVRDASGVPHLRLTPDGRCAALRGRPGERVRCDAYNDRPAACRRVQAGDELCRRYRRAHGLER